MDEGALGSLCKSDEGRAPCVGSFVDVVGFKTNQRHIRYLFAL